LLERVRSKKFLRALRARLEKKKELADVSERAREREREPAGQASGAIIWLAGLAGWLVGSTDAGRDNLDSADLYASKKSRLATLAG
jgi:hypothetical protein